MGNIVLLDDLTINKIAAGEVIERPASVVKEMLENSIDAGSKNITVEIKNGGISLIKISDDGSGIAKDDMEIAFERHATSKIRRAEDLADVTTLGFRGEALASIAAISRVEMVSKKIGDVVGNKIVVEGGKVLEFNEEARSVGTTITVQNLFYNTPVRYKFLKKDYTEAGYIEDVVTRIALVNLDVAIKLISNGKTILQTSGTGDLKSTIYSIYGKDISMEVIEVDYEYEEIRVRGVVGNPVIARSNRTNQLFFLNGRYIKDKNLTAAADQAYKGIVPVGRYGFLILNLQMDPKEADVNVHPAKLEVRFEDESKVFKAVYHAIKSSLTNIDDVNNDIQNIGFRTVIESKLQDTMEIPKINNFENSVKEVADDISKEKVTYSDVNKMFTENTNNNVVEESKKKQGIVGLFQKIIKEPEETEEEINNNYLEEIYKKNKGISEPVINNITENSDDYIGTNIKSSSYKSTDDIINNVISDFSSNIKGNTGVDNTNSNVIDNNEIEINTTKIDENVNSGLAKEILDRYAEKSRNMEAKKEAYKDESIEKIEEKVEATLSNAEKTFNEKWAEAGFSMDRTMPITNVENEENVIVENEKENKKENIESLSFESIAGELIKSNMNPENTQMIDTSEVRNAIKEENENLNNEETEYNVKEDLNKEENTVISEASEENRPEFEEMYKKTFGVEPFSIRKEREKEKELENVQKEPEENLTDDFSFANSNSLNVFDENEEITNIPYKYIGIAFNSYIIIEIKNDLYIVNQNLANERLIYEKIKANYYQEEGKDSQDLLLPDVITLSEKDMFIAKDNRRMFNKAGFSFSEFGENTIKLETVPSICEKLNTKQLFIDIISEIRNVAVNDWQEKEERFIYTIANKVSMSMNVSLEDDEARDLINNLLSISNPFENAKNNSIAIKMTKYDLERKFSRK